MRIAALPATVRLKLAAYQPDALDNAVSAAEEWLSAANAAGDAREAAAAADALQRAQEAARDGGPVFIARPLTPAELRRVQAELYVAQIEEQRALQPKPTVTGPDGSEIKLPAKPQLTADQKIALAEAETAVYMRVFQERITTIEALDIGEEPYDHARDTHRDAIELAWQIEIALQLIAGARLDVVTRGKSSSPSA